MGWVGGVVNQDCSHKLTSKSSVNCKAALQVNYKWQNASITVVRREDKVD